MKGNNSSSHTIKTFLNVILVSNIGWFDTLRLYQEILGYFSLVGFSLLAFPNNA